MKFAAVLALAMAPLALGAEFSKEDYATGKVHQRLMEMKNSQWDRDVAAGLHRPGRTASFKNWFKSDRVRCRNGKAVAKEGDPLQTYRCKNMDLYDFVNHADMGSAVGDGSSMWGWRARNGREFAAIGQGDGTAFVEVLKNGKLNYVGRLPQQSVPSRWREIRVVGDLCVIGSEAVAHGIQLFDMKKLLNIKLRDAPVTFSTSSDIVGLFNDTADPTTESGLPIGRSHNVVISWDDNYAVAVGAQPRTDRCKSGLIYIDLKDPSNPTSPGCASADGYSHDAQCMRYNGPDRRYNGRDLCIGYNEDTVTIWDVTDKTGLNASRVVSTLTYPNAKYIHQGWFIERNWHQYLILNDELDERDATDGPAAAGRPVTHIMDLSNLEQPKYTGWFYATDLIGIDHNLYVEDGLAYQSNYANGLWVHDVRSIPRDPTGKSVTVEGFFDIFPDDDLDPQVVFAGTWSHYVFPSGYIVVNTIERGAYTVRLNSGRGSRPGRGIGGPSRG